MTGPLHGLRGIVLTQAWAGSYCTSLLGMLGADVIQVEVRKRPDSWRGAYDGPIPARLKEVATAEHPWNTNSLYNSVNLNKRCITLDLSHPDGLETFRRLLPFADFCAENFSPRVLGNLGIDYDAMCAIKPDIILCSLSAYGHSGPWENVPGIGGTIEPTSGMSALLGYPGGPPLNSGQMYPDAVAGLNAAGAILTALHYRERTGRGQYIDLSMQEANLAFAGEAALEYLRTGRQRPRMGNRHPSQAPHGIYPTKDGDWVALACETDDDFYALRATLLHTAMDDERFDTLEGRKEHEDELDAIIADTTRDWGLEPLLILLQENGLPAAPVLDGAGVAQEQHLRDRGTVGEVTHPEAGTWPQALAPWRHSRSGRPPIRPAPRLGEHTFEVLAELLGTTQDEYEELVKAGISGTGPPGD